MISFLKKWLTNFGDNQFKKTVFYQLSTKLKKKVFGNNSNTENKPNFEEIKNKINLLQTNKIIVATKIKEFWNLQQQLVVKFETLLNNSTENEIILPYEENTNDSSNIFSIITTELIKMITTIQHLLLESLLLVVSISLKMILLMNCL